MIFLYFVGVAVTVDDAIIEKSQGNARPNCTLHYSKNNNQAKHVGGLNNNKKKPVLTRKLYDPGWEKASLAHLYTRQ